jgi:hypothetical protein
MGITVGLLNWSKIKFSRKYKVWLIINKLGDSFSIQIYNHSICVLYRAFVAQLGERKTEDLKVRGSIPRGGKFLLLFNFNIFIID